MARAIELSRRGFPAPNPHVGCVICLDGEVVGEGFCDHAGGDHAEAAALKQAGVKASGADLYVTLEPCAHFGRTPPCAQAILAAGIRRVFIAHEDPNPKAAGGAEALRQAGVHVEMGMLRAEAAEVNRVFLTAFALKRPFITIKAAISLDGKIAWPSGASKWITGQEARDAAHALRAEMGCILVGRKTLEMDNPQLTSRIPGVVNQPLRAVLDPQGLADPQAAALSDPEKAVWYVGKASRPEQTELSPFTAAEAAADLFRRGQIGALVEGGGQTIRHFVEAELFDRVALYMAPKIFGSGPEWLPTQHSWEPDALGLIVKSVRQIGTDIEIICEKEFFTN